MEGQLCQGPSRQNPPFLCHSHALHSQSDYYLTCGQVEHKWSVPRIPERCWVLRTSCATPATVTHTRPMSSQPATDDLVNAMCSMTDNVWGSDLFQQRSTRSTQCVCWIGRSQGIQERLFSNQAPSFTLIPQNYLQTPLSQNLREPVYCKQHLQHALSFECRSCAQHTTKPKERLPKKKTRIPLQSGILTWTWRRIRIRCLRYPVLRLSCCKTQALYQYLNLTGSSEDH